MIYETCFVSVKRKYKTGDSKMSVIIKEKMNSKKAAILTGDKKLVHKTLPN